MFRKALLLLLAILILPACAALPPLFPQTPSPKGQAAEEDLFQKAESNYRHQAYRTAWQGYLTYLERYPQGKHAQMARAREAELLGLLGDWQGSLKAYQKLLAQFPEPDIALKARYGLGRAYFKLGQYQQAVQVLDNLTAADLPRSLWFSTQALLCEVALKQGQVSQAFARLRLAAQDLPSGDHEWFEDLKTRVVDAATPGELENLATLYRDTPLSAALLLRLARLSQEAGRLAEAQKWSTTLKERFPNSPEAVAADRLLAKGKIMVGVLLPLSGEFSNIGLKVQRGMELAAREAPVELVFRDTHNDPGTAAQMVREIAQDSRILAILGPLTSGVAQTAAETAQVSGVPLIALSQKAGLTQAGNLIFQAFITPRQQARALLSRTLGQQGLRRYAILYPESAYGRTYAEQFQEEAEAQGGEIVVKESYAPGTRDFTAALASLEQAFKSGPAGTSGFQALFIPDDSATVAAVALKLAENPRRRVQLLGTNLIHPAELSAEQLQALNGIIFPEAFFGGDPNAAVQSFISAFRQHYGTEPDYLSAQGYVAVRLLARLAETEKSLSRADLPRQLLSLKGSSDLPWFQGFNANREEEPFLYLLTIRDGRLQLTRSASEIGI
jgi:ABC-type branched-subunit amino acid transport system substrate-binding protein